MSKKMKLPTGECLIRNPQGTATDPNLSASAQSAQQDGTLPGPSGIQQQTGPSRNHGAEVSTLLRSNF